MITTTLRLLQKFLERYGNPTRFMAVSARVLPWLIAVTAAVMAYGLYRGLGVSPPDYQQGQTVKINAETAP